MSCIGKIDWDLFFQQKLTLLRVAEDATLLSTQEIEDLDGIINLMDALQDEFCPPDKEVL